MKFNQSDISEEIKEAVVLIVVLGSQLEERENHFLLKTELLRNRKLFPNLNTCVGDSNLHNMHTAFCQGSGFFIEQRIVVTAAHVLLDSTKYLDLNIKNIRFIKNYHVDLPKIGNKVIIEKENVFMPKKGMEELKYFNYTSMGEDWALVPVDSVEKEGRFPPPIKTNSKLDIEITGDYSWIGHPMGLPKVRHLPAKGIKDDPNKSFFEISNVAYGGLSGAPVLKDGQIVGIVVRGNGQLTLDNENNCIKLFERPSGSELFEGTECQRIELIEDELNQLLLEIQEETPGTPLT